MPPDSETNYPSRRTYVLKVYGDAKPDALAGRLENPVTGQQQVFASGYELVAWIATDLRASHDEAQANSNAR